jgi:transposase
MIHLPASVRVYLCLSACDMRLSFDGLHALVRDHLQLDAFAGHLYLFASRRKDRLKIMYWDTDGFAIWAKRLEAGVYKIRKHLVKRLPSSFSQCPACEKSGLSNRAGGFPAMRQQFT